jgi:aspartyl/glutamyl-tRNA(Asn/Gln) amidotransferase C subunit
MADSSDVARLAALSRISVPPAELESFAKDFDSIITYIGQLDGLDLASTAPAVPLLHNVFRVEGAPDVARIFSEKIIAQFPSRDGDSLSVKKIITH